MADDMTNIEQSAKPRAQEVAKRWMQIKGVKPPHEEETVETSENNTAAIQDAYDLFVEKQELRDQIVGSQRQMMEPASEQVLTLDQKRELIQKGRIRQLLPTTGSEQSNLQVIHMSQQRIGEVDDRLDQIFEKPGVYREFQQDLSHQVEVRHKAHEVGNLVRFGQEADLLALKLSRRAQVEGRPLTSVERQVIDENRALQEVADSRSAELTQDPEVFDRLRTVELQRYRQQLNRDHYAETPSRQLYLKKIEGYWTEGKKVLLSGETGTGKTEMVKHASNKLFGVNPEPVTGHQDMSIYELLGKTGFQVQVGDVFRPAPLIRAMTGRDGRGQPFLFDEIDRAPNQAVMGIKTILNARPGEKGVRVQTDTAGSFDVGPDYAVAATANIKSEKYQTATELDPAIVRVFDAPLEIDYMPAHEVYDLALASLIDRRGGIPLSEQDARTTLKNLCDAASWIQDAYQGRKIVTDPSNNKFIEARGQGSTGRAASLQKALLDPGRTIDMLKGWSGAQARGISFEDYISERVIEFINNRAYPEDDRYYLAEIFALKGLLKGAKVSELSVSGLTQAVLDSWSGSTTKTRGRRQATRASLPADRVAQLDPYRRSRRPVAAEAEELLELAGEALPQSGQETAQFPEAREIFGEEFFGPDEIEKAFDIAIDREAIPEIPFSRDELEQAKANGQYLILRVDKDGPIPLTILIMNAKLQSKFERDGKGKILYDTSWYKDEDFAGKATPRTRWALATREPIPNSTSKNYLEQTGELALYIDGAVFKDRTIPADWQEAINEYVLVRSEIKRDLSDNWQEAARRLSELKLNQMARQTPVEALYDYLVYFQNTGRRIMESSYTWTNRQASDGGLVVVGYADAGGAYVSRWLPDVALGHIGVCFSR